MDRRLLLSGSLALLAAGCTRRPSGPVIGSKNFTEQLILGEILSQWLHRHLGLLVEDRFYLAGTYICHQAMLAGRIDSYVEYTGTALAAVLKENYTGDPASVYGIVKSGYKRRFNMEVMAPLGFNNSFAMVVRGDDAQRKGVTKLSELTKYAPGMRLGVGYEFLERADGYQGLARVYDLKFAEAPRVMDLGLLYRALQNQSVDIVAGSNTDGLIAALGLVVLQDDRSYFPPYDAVPIVRSQALKQFAGMESAISKLSGKISAQQMRAMNYAVDGQKQDAAQVAAGFVYSLLERI